MLMKYSSVSPLCIFSSIHMNADFIMTIMHAESIVFSTHHDEKHTPANNFKKLVVACWLLCFECPLPRPPARPHSYSYLLFILLFILLLHFECIWWRNTFNFYPLFFHMFVSYCCCLLVRPPTFRMMCWLLLFAVIIVIPTNMNAWMHVSTTTVNTATKIIISRFLVSKLWGWWLVGGKFEWMNLSIYQSIQSSFRVVIYYYLLFMSVSHRGRSPYTIWILSHPIDRCQPLAIAQEATR